MCAVQTLNTGSLFYATLNAIAYFYMVRFVCLACLVVFFPQFIIFIFIFCHPGLLLGRIYLYY